MKMKEFGPPGRGACPWRPLRSANAKDQEIHDFICYFGNSDQPDLHAPL